MIEPTRPRRRPLSEEEAELAVRAPIDHGVGPAIQEFLEKSGFTPIVQFGAIANVWDEVVGEDVALHCRPLRLDGQELVVQVDHRGWITELSFRQADILRGLEEHLDGTFARRLKVTLRSGSGLE